MATPEEHPQTKIETELSTIFKLMLPIGTEYSIIKSKSGPDMFLFYNARFWISSFVEDSNNISINLFMRIKDQFLVCFPSGSKIQFYAKDLQLFWFASQNIIFQVDAVLVFVNQFPTKVTKLDGDVIEYSL
jgi:hypothetical protein